MVRQGQILNSEWPVLTQTIVNRDTCFWPRLSLTSTHYRKVIPTKIRSLRYNERMNGLLNQIASKLTNLTSVDLRDAFPAPADFFPLSAKHLSNISKLFIHGDASVRSLFSPDDGDLPLLFPKLEKLNISSFECQIDILSFHRFPQLRHLDLAVTPQLIGETIDSIVQHCPQLRALKYKDRCTLFRFSSFSGPPGDQTPI